MKQLPKSNSFHPKFSYPYTIHAPSCLYLEILPSFHKIRSLIKIGINTLLPSFRINLQIQTSCFTHKNKFQTITGYIKQRHMTKTWNGQDSPGIIGNQPGTHQEPTRNQANNLESGNKQFQLSMFFSGTIFISLSLCDNVTNDCVQN